MSAVARANPRAIVVLETGGAVFMPWINEVRGVFHVWYPGCPTELDAYDIPKPKDTEEFEPQILVVDTASDEVRTTIARVGGSTTSSPMRLFVLGVNVPRLRRRYRLNHF